VPVKRSIPIGNERARGGGGKFVRERKSANILKVMRPLEPYMTGEIADELG
jgi:hypothetical protein